MKSLAECLISCALGRLGMPIKEAQPACVKIMARRAMKDLYGEDQIAAFVTIDPARKQRG